MTEQKIPNQGVINLDTSRRELGGQCKTSILSSYRSVGAFRADNLIIPRFFRLSRVKGVDFWKNTSKRAKNVIFLTKNVQLCANKGVIHNGSPTPEYLSTYSDDEAFRWVIGIEKCGIIVAIA